MLDHSSGIYGFNNDEDYLDVWLGKKYDPDKKWSSEELIGFSRTGRRKPFGEPGTGNYYSDTNYVLLRLIIEKRSGTSLRSFVKKKIIKPLSLSNTGYYGMMDDEDAAALTTTVRGYLKRSELLDSVITLDKRFKSAGDSLVNTTSAVERLDGPSGMVSSAEDLLIFGRALYSGKLLSKKSLKWVLAPADKVGMENGSSRQGVIKFHRESFGILFSSNGDGPAGINITLGYHPNSDTVVVGFTNIFGLF